MVLTVKLIPVQITKKICFYAQVKKVNFGLVVVILIAKQLHKTIMENPPTLLIIINTYNVLITL